MSTPTIERTGDWDSVPFAGGYAGLRDLADDEFSGMVTTGPTRLFMLRGAVVGVLDGDIEDFDEGGGTAREAPHPALPLLAVMQERSDEVRAKYYTEETPLSEVDRTLSDGNFTGYIELAENVLSGDYYQVYHQGRSMSVAYVGASERLITDDEAFEQADDEVGIYEVRPVDVEIIDIPEPEDDDTAGGTTAAAGSGGGEAGIDTDAEATEDIGSTDLTATDENQNAGDAVASDGTVEPDDTAATAGGAGADNESEPSTSTADVGGADDTATTTDEQPVAEAEPDEGSDVETAPDSAATTSGTDEAEPSETTSDAPAASTDAGGDRSGSATGAGAGAAAGAGSQSTDSTESNATESQAGETSTAGSSTGGSSSANTDTTSSPAAAGGSADAATGQSGSGAGGGQAGRTQQGQPAPDHPAAASRGQGGESAGNGSASADRPEESIGAGDLEVRSLPSLDPSRTASASRQERERRSASASGGTSTTTNAQRSEPSQSGGRANQQGASGAGATGAGASTEGSQAAGQSGQAASGGAAGQGAADANAESATAEQATSESAAGTQTEPEAGESDTEDAGGASSEELEEARAEVQRLESELSELEGEHEAVVEERDRLEAELAEAREEIDRLRGRLEDAADQGTEASQKLSPRQAIDETNLFIRYDSKGEATLEKAHAGDVDKDAVDANMRLEYHTSFDANDAAVDGVDFDSFLTDTVQYRFVDWLVRQLLYEIRDTGNTGSMGELYDALPKVDRAELNGQVGVQYTENGEEHRAQVGFDVIVRDRMGNPLIVANLNDSRDPATDSMMTDLVRTAERVGESSSSLAGAFLVTRSFFEPEALETAEEATAGGLLNRSKQKSFVNLSRKGGYHLCLVEARNEEFHLAVPEL